ncbi:MAG: hypothetical protein ACRCVT_12720 [Leadbetterella sp.]
MINFSGSGPWNYVLDDGINYISRTSSNTQIIFPVTPDVSRLYQLSSVSGTGACSSGSVIGSLAVNVSPVPVLTYNTPTTTSVCPGGIIAIPYTLLGNVGINRSLSVNMLTNSGSSVSSSYMFGFSTNPIYYQVPTSVTAGTYKFSLSSQIPYINNSITSPYTFEVVNNNCPAMPQASIQSFDSTCTVIRLRAVPSGNDYTYQWFKDDSLLYYGVTTSSTIYVNNPGNYKVRVTNSNGSYNSTSNYKNIKLKLGTPILTSPNRSLCGTNTTTTINSSITNPNFTYSWSKNNINTAQYEIISGETNPNISTGIGV